MNNQKKAVKLLKTLAKATVKYDEKQRLKKHMDTQIDRIKYLSVMKSKNDLEKEVSKLKTVVSKLIEKEKINDLLSKEEEDKIWQLKKELKTGKSSKAKEKKELMKKLKLLESKYKKLKKTDYKKSDLKSIELKIKILKKKLS
jgi:hypothetical protein